jgi:hypothetical protein
MLPILIDLPVGSPLGFVSYILHIVGSIASTLVAM